MDILIIRFSSLGDVVMAAAVVEALHKRFPYSHIHFITKSVYSGVFENDERISTVTGIQGSENPFAIVSMLGRRNFDAVVDLHGSMRSIAVSTLLKSPMKMRVSKHSIARRLMVWSHNRYRRSFDVLGNYLDTLRPFDITERTLPFIKPSGKSLKSADAILADIKKVKSGRFIGFAPGAKHSVKRWDEESYALVADKCARRHHVPVFIGDKNDIDVILRIRGSMEKDSLSFAGEIDLSVTVALISRLDTLITNDSGPMHIAGAVGTPFVAIFGPTHPDLGFAPGYPSGKILHSGAECSPCSIHGEVSCRKGKRMCMDEITWEIVMEAINSL